MEKITLEIRDAEGGSDAKLLVTEMLNIYIKAAKNNNFNWLIETRDGFASIWLTGKGVKKIFRNEIGSHRWCRVPPTEKRGRVHTSTITVSMSSDDGYKDVELNYNDIKTETTRGRGAGGQHRNTTDSCIVMTHCPTGIKVVSNGRSQHDNRDSAYSELKKRVNNYYRTNYNDKVSDIKRDQIGDGSRSDKRRTYRVKDGIVIDHITNKTASIKDILKGKINLLK